MQLWRKHISKLIILLLVLSGFGLQLLQPFSAQQHSHAFTRWLESVVKKEHEGEVRQQLEQLQTHTGELAPLIHKASRIVHRNGEDFQLPVDQHGNSPSDIYHLLVKEWNQYQSGESMQPLSMPVQDSKNISIFPRLISLAYNSFQPVDQTSLYIHGTFSLLRIIPNPIRIDAIPLIGGTAIGAP